MILIVLYEIGIWEAIVVDLGRVFMVGLLRGTLVSMGFLMSLTGAALSLGIMILLYFFDIEAVKEELADVLTYCQNMLDKLGLDEDEIVNAKMAKNEAKYPVEKAKGKADKYTKL